MTIHSHKEVPPGFLSPEIYQEIFQRANDAILIFRPEDEVILEANQRAEELYGYARDKLIGMSLKQFTINVRRGEEELQKLLQVGRYDNFETMHRHRDGSILFLQSNAAVIQFEGATAILAIARDMSEIKRVEEELRQRSAHLNALIEENPLGIVVVDCLGQIITCNPAFTSIFRWSEQEIIGVEEHFLARSVGQRNRALHGDQHGRGARCRGRCSGRIRSDKKQRHCFDAEHFAAQYGITIFRR